MSNMPFREISRSATFRRAAVALGGVWIFLMVGGVWLFASLSSQLEAGWSLRASVEELIGDPEAEICMRMIDGDLQVATGDPTRWQSSQTPLLDEGSDDLDSMAEFSSAEAEPIGVAEPGLALGELQTPGDWLCVARETVLDNEMEALTGVAIEVRNPRSLFPVWALGGLWAALSLVLVLGVASRMASSPVALVRDLERVREQIEQGDQSSRLRRRDRGGDMDAAATGINAILDRLDYTISTLSEVSDNIAHDLRTPLTRLQGQLDLVRRSETPTAAMIDAVQDEAGQLLATFNALLRIAQVKGGSKRKGFRYFDLGPVVNDAGDYYGPAMTEAELGFTCRVPAGAVKVYGDPDLWMQAISNLLDNALKYAPPTSEVDLDLQPGRPGSRIAAHIQIRDSGHGIPEPEIDKVLERFYRLSAHRSQRGSGLGLSLVAAICQLHDAEIELKNQHGLTVSIVIPTRE